MLAAVGARSSEHPQPKSSAAPSGRDSDVVARATAGGDRDRGQEENGTHTARAHARGGGEGMQEHPRIPRRAARHTCMHPLWPVHRARGALASPRREGPAGAPAPSRARRSSATSFPRRAPRAYPATSASAPTTTVPRARAHLTMICATCSCDARQRHARRTKWSGK